MTATHPSIRPLLLLLLIIALQPTISSAKPQITAREALLQALDLPFESPLTPHHNHENDRSLSQLQSDIIAYAESLVAQQHHSKQALKYFRLAAILGHAGAAASAATLLISSQPDLPRDIQAAVRHLRFAAARGQPDAHSQLAMLHASGLADRYGVPKSIPRAIVHWTVAANSGSIYAATALGFRHFYGIDVPHTCASAAMYYKRAATAIATDSRHWPSPANFMYGKMPLPSRLVDVGRVRLSEDALNGVPPQMSSDDDVIHFYRHAADRGDRDALALLGALSLFGGNGIPPNEQNARVDLERAAAQNHGESHGILAHLAMRNGDNETAYTHFRHSAAAQSKIGHYGLGMIFRHGLMGHKVDNSKARMHFTLAGEREHAGAFFQLGLMSWKGIDVVKSPEEAFKFFQNAARFGNLQSKLNLGVIHLEGTQPLSKPNCTLAVKYLKHVAEQGEWKTVFDIASNSLESGDVFGALYRNMQGAHAGIELAQYNVGLLLEKTNPGDIPELAHWDRQRMIEEAHEMYMFSGTQGHSESTIRSGHMAYLESEDYTAAADKYRRGIEKKNAEAMFSLGMMYVQGKGVELSRSKALHFLHMCAGVDKESAIAVNLALIGVRANWMLTDVWQWLRSALPSALRAGPSLNDKSQSGTVSSHGLRKDSTPLLIRITSVSSDVALMALLLIFLIVTLLIRRQRLVR